MMIKILQATTVGIFALIVFLGALVFFFLPEKLVAFNQLVNSIFPLFLAQVVPALIGTPLTEAVRNLTANPPGSPPQGGGTK